MVEPLALAVVRPQPAPSLGFYSWHVGTLRDGRITNDLPMVSTSWSDVMDDAGTLSGTLNLADPAVAALNPYLTAEPCRCFLAVSYTDPTGTETFLAGGPIWSHSYDDPTRKLTIAAAGLWSYYDHRKILPVLLAGVNPATVTTEVVASLGTIASKLVQLAHTHTAGSVPVVFPADETGTIVKDYQGYDLPNLGQALRDLTGLQGGPEIQFVPRRRTDDRRYIEWVMRVGTTADPLLHQTGEDWAWDASVPRSSITGISVQRDGSAMGTRAWMQGAGSQVETLFGRADDTILTTAGFPLLEVAGSGQESEDSRTALDSAAAGLLAAQNRPVETWTVKVRRDEAPTVAQYAVGDWVSLKIDGWTRLGTPVVSVDGNDLAVPSDGNDLTGVLDGNLPASSQPTTTKHPYLPSGTYRSRILSRSGDDSQDITLQLAPTLGGI